MNKYDIPVKEQKKPGAVVHDVPVETREEEHNQPEPTFRAASNLNFLLPNSEGNSDLPVILGP